MDTGESAVGVLDGDLDRNYNSGGPRAVLDFAVFVPADSPENEKDRHLLSGGAAVKPAVYESMPEKPGTAGPAFSAVSAAGSTDSGAP